MLTRKNLHRREELFFNSILSALLRLVLKFDFATLRNSEGATVTHLTIAPSQSVTDPLPPLGSITLNSGASCVVRSQTPTPLASCVSGHTREAVSNFRNLLCVKLAYYCCN